MYKSFEEMPVWQKSMELAVKIFEITERLPRGTVHSACSSAVYDPIGEPGNSIDRAGTINLLTSSRPVIKKSHSTASNTCLVQVEKWQEQS